VFDNMVQRRCRSEHQLMQCLMAVKQSCLCNMFDNKPDHSVHSGTMALEISAVLGNILRVIMDNPALSCCGLTIVTVA